MKFKIIYSLVIFAVLLFATACGEKEDIIPPAPPRPEPPGPPYNDLGFEPHKPGEPFNTYRGLVMTGYQGWFCCPPGAVCPTSTAAPGTCLHSTAENVKWYHYREHEQFAPGVRRNSIDMWPDMREYAVRYIPGEQLTNITSGNREFVPFVLPNGEHATVFSSYDRSTVMLHFKWMQEYGIDGAFMQRFIGEVINNRMGEDHFNTVLGHAMAASNQHQRAICVMYDLSSMDRSTPVMTYFQRTLDDAKWIMEQYRLLDRNHQRFYLYERGKPLIAVWGVGFNDNRPYSLDDLDFLISGLKDLGFSIMLGVPTHWRTLDRDAVSDPRFHDIIRKSDVILPWFVGRYGMSNFNNFHQLVIDDLAWCNTNGVEYAPLAFAGSSDLGMYPHHNHRNERHGGQFLWNQVFHHIESGAKMIYLAMFDEIDEGTALFKMLRQNEVPSNRPTQDYFVTRRGGSYSIGRNQVTNLPNPAPAFPWPANTVINGDWSISAMDLYNRFGDFHGIENHLPTDHYLWLSGQARLMLRGEIPLNRTLPVR